MKRAILIALVLTTISQAGSAAEYRTISPGVVGLMGGIDAGDERRLRDIMARGRASGTPLRVLVLEYSNGGNTEASMGMALMLNQAGVETRVTGRCTSACVTIYAGGRTRSLSRNATLCVHSARTPDTVAGPGAREDAESRETTLDLARFLWTLGAPYGVLGKLTVTPPARLTCLDSSDYVDWLIRVD